MSSRIGGAASPLWILALVLSLGLVAGSDAQAGALKVQVVKAGETFVVPAAPECNSSKVHLDRAGTWVPERAIRIVAVSIPEQSEISLYTDIEVSTAPEMYLPEGHIFRVKYAGPMISRNPSCPVEFHGSNITTTNITFPQGSYIRVKAGQPVYVHLDVINWTPYTIDPFTQDVYIYYQAGGN